MIDRGNCWIDQYQRVMEVHHGSLCSLLWFASLIALSAESVPSPIPCGFLSPTQIKGHFGGGTLLDKGMYSWDLARLLLSA
jgi:hypothetical protein